MFTRLIGVGLVCGTIGAGYALEKDYRQRFTSKHKPTRMQVIILDSPSFLANYFLTKIDISTETLSEMFDEDSSLITKLTVKQQNDLILHDIKFLELVPSENISQSTICYLLHTTNLNKGDLVVTQKLADLVYNYFHVSKPNTLVNDNLFKKLVELNPPILLENTGLNALWYNDNVILQILEDNILYANYISKSHFSTEVFREIIKQYQEKYPHLDVNKAEFWKIVIADIPTCSHFLVKRNFYQDLFTDETTCKKIVENTQQPFLEIIPQKYRTQEIVNYAVFRNKRNSLYAGKLDE